MSFNWSCKKWKFHSMAPKFRPYEWEKDER